MPEYFIDDTEVSSDSDRKKSNKENPNDENSDGNENFAKEN